MFGIFCGAVDQNRDCSGAVSLSISCDYLVFERSHVKHRLTCVGKTEPSFFFKVLSVLWMEIWCITGLTLNHLGWALRAAQWPWQWKPKDFQVSFAAHAELHYYWWESPCSSWTGGGSGSKLVGWPVSQSNAVDCEVGVREETIYGICAMSLLDWLPDGSVQIACIFPF